MRRSRVTLATMEAAAIETQAASPRTTVRTSNGGGPHRSDGPGDPDDPGPGDPGSGGGLT